LRIFNRYVVAQYRALSDGLWVTIYVCFWAFLLAIVLGLVACFVRMRVPYLRVVAIAYIEFCRATPILVQLLWVNYVWPEIFGFPQTVNRAGIMRAGIAVERVSRGNFPVRLRGASERPA